MLALINDVTERRKAREQRDHLQKMESLYEAKSAMLSNVSHEVGTPLHVIQNYAQMLRDGMFGTFPVEANKPLERIAFNTKHLIGLFETMLNLAKAEKGKIEVRLEEFDPLKILREHVQGYYDSCWKPTLKLETDFPASCGKISSDLTKFGQAVDNLLSNAVKYTKQGRISVGLRELKLANAPFVVFWICDTGIGILTEDLPLLKTAFFRSKLVTEQFYEGTGLGLANVDSNLQLLGGTLEIASVVGEGTVVMVALPQGRGHSPPQELSQQAKQLIQTTKEIAVWNQHKNG